MQQRKKWHKDDLTKKLNEFWSLLDQGRIKVHKRCKIV